MTVLADFLRDTTGKIWRIYPNTRRNPVTGQYQSAELLMTDSLWDDAWSDPSYTIPTAQALTYRTLADSAGKTWYIYMNTNGEIVITDTAPTVTTGVWSEPLYGLPVTPNEATTGNEIYLSLVDSAATDWFVYPNADGELVISTTEPT